MPSRPANGQHLAKHLEYAMPTGFHDSTWANGPAIKERREFQGWTRDDMVDHSRGAFSQRTLQRAEGSGRVSREKLAKIAEALGLTFEEITLETPSAQFDEKALRVHHWDDEASDLVHVATSLSFAIEAKAGEEVMRRKLTSQLSKYHFEISSPRTGVKIHYLLYENFADFLRNLNSNFQSNDLAVLDVLNHTGTGRFASDGLEGALKINRMVKRDNIAFFTAFPELVSQSGPSFHGIKVISKTDVEQLSNFILSRFQDLLDSMETR